MKNPTLVGPILLSVSTFKVRKTSWIVWLVSVEKKKTSSIIHQKS